MRDPFRSTRSVRISEPAQDFWVCVCVLHRPSLATRPLKFCEIYRKHPNGYQNCWCTKIASFESLDDRQTTHLICVCLKHLLHDFLWGVLGLLPVVFLYKRPKPPTKKSHIANVLDGHILDESSKVPRTCHFENHRFWYPFGCQRTTQTGTKIAGAPKLRVLTVLRTCDFETGRFWYPFVCCWI